MKTKSDLIATNYPFGMSNKLEIGDSDWNKYWHVLKRTKTSFVKNSSAQFIVHIHHSLKKNGRAAFVSDRGILNNGCDKQTSWESKLRKFMFEENDVYKIIFLPQGAFTYTNFQTCIIFMKKGNSTKKCELYDALFRVIKDKTSEIYVDDKPLKVFTIKDLQKNNYSIKIEAFKEEIKEGWIKLGDVVKFVRGMTITINKLLGGPYKVIGGGYTFMDKTHNIFNCVENTVIMSGDGAYAGYLNKFSEKILITNHCNKMVIKDEDNYNNDYIYYYLKINYQARLITRDHDGYQKGQAQPAIDLHKMYNEIHIPLLSLSHQEEIVEILHNQFTIHNIELLTPYTKEIDLFKLLIHKKYDYFIDALHIIFRKIETDTLYIKLELDKKAIFNMQINLVENEEYKLKDIVKITKGSFNTKDTDNSGIYPYYNSGCKNPSGSHSEFTCDHNECILFVKDGGDKANPFNENSGMCKPFFVKEKVAVNNHLLIFTNKKIKIYILQYLYMFLEYNRKDLMKFAKYNSGLGSIIMNTIENHSVKIPSLKNQKKIITEINKLESEQSSYKIYSKMLQEQIDKMIPKNIMMIMIIFP